VCCWTLDALDPFLLKRAESLFKRLAGRTTQTFTSVSSVGVFGESEESEVNKIETARRRREAGW